MHISKFRCFGNYRIFTENTFERISTSAPFWQAARCVRAICDTGAAVAEYGGILRSPNRSSLPLEFFVRFDKATWLELCLAGACLALHNVHIVANPMRPHPKVHCHGLCCTAYIRTTFLIRSVSRSTSRALPFTVLVAETCPVRFWPIRHLALIVVSFASASPPILASHHF